MDQLTDFYERHRRFVLSLAYLVFAVFVAGYAIPYSTRAAWTHHVTAAKRLYDVENRQLKQQVDAAKEALAKGDEEDEAGIRSLPDFLARINNVAHAADVIIHKLSPDEKEPLRFTIQILEDYNKFLNFSSMLESLNVSIHDIEVHPYKVVEKSAQGGTKTFIPIHAITFSITPREDAKPLSSARISELRARVAQKNKRNPFQRFAYDPEAKKVRPEIDLTWVYRLSGIGRVGGMRTATIDSKDYAKDDLFKGMKIVGIESQRVRFEKQTDHGVEKYQLKFRRKKGSGKRKRG